MAFFASALESLATWFVHFIYAVVLWEVWRRIGWPRIVGNHGGNNVTMCLFGCKGCKKTLKLTGLQTEHPRNATDDSGYNSEESNVLFQPHTSPQPALQDRLGGFVDASNYALKSAYPQPQATGPLATLKYQSC